MNEKEKKKAVANDIGAILNGYKLSFFYSNERVVRATISPLDVSPSRWFFNEPPLDVHQEVILSVTNPLSSRGLSGMYLDLWIPGKIVLTPSTELVQSKSNFQFPIWKLNYIPNSTSGLAGCPKMMDTEGAVVTLELIVFHDQSDYNQQVQVPWN